MSTNASYEYLKNSVMTAPPEQLQMMLFDGAIRFATRAKECLAAKDFEGAFNGFDRAQKIVLQLHTGLRREVDPELVDRVASLYNFIYRRLIDASTERDPAPVDEALQVLRHLRETWVMLLDKLAEERRGAVPLTGGQRPVAATTATARPVAATGALSIEG